MRRRRLKHAPSFDSLTAPSVSEQIEPRRVEFDSLTALAAYVANMPTGKSSHKHNTMPSWTFGVDFDAAVKLAQHGWPEGAAEAKRLLDTVAVPPITDYHSTTTNDVTGSYVDVGEYVQGTPECMVNFQEDKRNVRFVRIIVGGFFSAFIEDSIIMARGVCIAAIIDALESRGIRCEVEHRITINEGLWTAATTIKRYTDPLNLDTIAFALAHPAMYRRLNFAVQELESEDMQRKYRLADYGAYGHKAQITEPGALIFQSLFMSDDWSIENAAKRINDVLTHYAEGE